MKMADMAAALRQMDGRSVEIGFFDSSRYNDGTPMAAVAAWNEFGTPDAKHPIPPRPFMRKAIEDGNKGIDRRLQIDIPQMLAGKYTVDQMLARIGQHYVGAVVESIKGGGWTPNADATVAGKGFDAPLIDGGDLWQSVNFNVT